MSWAEALKMNSDRNSPLNHVAWLADYKLYGQDSFVYQDKERLHELYQDYSISVNDRGISGEALDYICSQGKEVGKALGKAYGVAGPGALEKEATLEGVLGSEGALAALFSSRAAMDAVASSKTIMGAVAASKSLLSAIAASATARGAIKSSDVAYAAMESSPLLVTATGQPLYNGQSAIYGGLAYLLSAGNVYGGSSSGSQYLYVGATAPGGGYYSMGSLYETRGWHKANEFLEPLGCYTNYPNGIGNVFQCKYIPL